MIKLIGKAKASYRWVKALALASNEEYVDALEQIEEIEKIFPIAGEVKLFRGYLYYAIGEHEEAVTDLSSSCTEIDESESYSDDEKRYLKCYASVFGRRCIEGSKHGGDYRFHVNYGLVDLGRVSKAIKNNFPLRSHPNWEKN